MTVGSAVEMRTVRLLQLPLRLWAQAKQNMDELTREFTLMTADSGGDADGHDTPARLVALAAELQQQYGAGAEQREAPLFAALQAGEKHVDQTFELPVAAAGAAQTLGVMLDEADEYCRQGKHLLALETPPELVAYRRWYLDEVIGQMGGAEPTPWPNRVRATGSG